MFIREITKKSNGVTYTYHRLSESYRNSDGKPRQRIILDLGKLDIPSKDWKSLADRIEELVHGKGDRLFPIGEHLETLARYYARIIQKNMLSEKEITEFDIEEKEEEEIVQEIIKEEIEIVELQRKSWEIIDTRSISAEYIGVEMFKKLGMDNILGSIGFTEEQIHMSALSIVGRLVNPDSENATRRWAIERSGMDDLLNANFRHLSNNMLYRTSDLLFENKEEIEGKLRAREKALYGLEEKIVLYDLTNTYFEGEGTADKLKRGKSKENRTDCVQITLGLVIDESGFPKYSRIFEGNISEPGTFEEILEEIEKDNNKPKDLLSSKTVIMDAGIATKDNIEKIKKKEYHYISMSRRKEYSTEELAAMNVSEKKVIVKEDVEAAIIEKTDEEIIVYCESKGRKLKETAIKNSFQEHFETELKKLRDGLLKPKCIKEIGKVHEKIGRLKEKYSKVASFYEIEIKEESGKASEINWKVKNDTDMINKFSGSYYIKTSRTDLSEKEVWNLYMTLTKVESAFRYLKSSLGLRPVYHEKQERIEGHLFISVLAYHLLISIQHELNKAEIHHDWSYIMKGMKQMVISSTYLERSGNRVYEKRCSNPSEFESKIFSALKLKRMPVEYKMVKM